MDVLTIIIVAATVSAIAVTFVLVAYLVGNPLPWMLRHWLATLLVIMATATIFALWLYHVELWLWLESQWQDLSQMDLASYWAAWGMQMLFVALAALVVVLLLVAIFRDLRAAFSGWGLVFAALLFATLAALLFFASPHLVALAKAVTKRFAETTLEEWFLLAIFALTLFVLIVRLFLGTSTGWTKAAAIAAVVLISILVGPSLRQWVNNNTALCVGSEAECYKMVAKQSEAEAQAVYARQLAIAKANRDAQRMVSAGCPGNEQVLNLRPDITSHFNLNKCAVQAEVLSGKVIFVDWTGLRTSQPLGPNDRGTIDFVIAGAYAAPGYKARIKYSLCSSESKIPLSYECLPRNS